MRRVRHYVERRDLAVFERIIELYGPCVLVRCARYTNSRQVSLQIGAHVLICTCLMLRKLDRPGQIGILVEVMLETIGPDVVSGGGGRLRSDEVDEPLIADGRMREIAEVLNRLERPLREALVLHHLGGMDVSELARLLQKPRGEVAASLGQARKALAESPGGSWADDAGPLPANFASVLDAHWLEEVGCCAMAYLARQAEGPRRSTRCGLN